MSINGKVYEPGDSIPPSEAVKIRSLNVLLSTRRIVPTYDEASRPVRQNAVRKGPSYVNPRIRSAQGEAPPEPKPVKKTAAKKTAAKKTAVADESDAG
jgi:hypothetical protein